MYHGLLRTTDFRVVGADEARCGHSALIVLRNAGVTVNEVDIVLILNNNYEVERGWRRCGTIYRQGKMMEEEDRMRTELKIARVELMVD